jgi:hypothetical protein
MRWLCRVPAALVVRSDAALGTPGGILVRDEATEFENKTGGVLSEWISIDPDQALFRSGLVSFRHGKKQTDFPRALQIERKTKSDIASR